MPSTPAPGSQIDLARRGLDESEAALATARQAHEQIQARLQAHRNADPPPSDPLEILAQMNAAKATARRGLAEAGRALTVAEESGDPRQVEQARARLWQAQQSWSDQISGGERTRTARQLLREAVQAQQDVDRLTQEAEAKRRTLGSLTQQEVRFGGQTISFAAAEKFIEDNQVPTQPQIFDRDTGLQFADGRPITLTYKVNDAWALFGEPVAEEAMNHWGKFKNGKVLQVEWHHEDLYDEQNVPERYRGKLAFKAKAMWEQEVRPTLEPGTLLMATPYGGQGSGRDRLYQCGGFGRAGRDNHQWAMVRGDGKLYPIEFVEPHPDSKIPSRRK